MDGSLSSRLHGIEQLGSAVRRGRQLEHLVADLFRQLHFEVRINPGTARPRQTDVLASKAGEVYLIECKWRSDKTNVDDIDSLRSRLRRTNGGVVGILISFNGFSGSVLFNVEHHREQPVLLISGDELRRATGRMETFADLLWRKKDALLTDGRVILDEPVTKHARSKRTILTLPDAGSSFLTSAGLRTSVVECGGSFSGMLFARELDDIDWVPANGHGVTLDVTPPARNERELLDVVAKLADLGWATSDASWSIQQTTRNWHGMGTAAFAEHLPRWKHRATTSGAHHSEQICYFDRCDGGFYTLTASVAAHRSRRTLAPILSFQFQGIPLDTGPLLQLCRSVGIHEGLYFRPRSEPSLRRYRDGKALATDVTPIHLITSQEATPDRSGERWVTGVVIANPFHMANGHEGPSLPPEIPSQVRESEHLICALAHHHPRDGRKLSYDLVRLEGTSTSDALVICPVVDWLDRTSQSSGDRKPNRM
jgi:Holliday junction resolvase